MMEAPWMLALALLLATPAFAGCIASLDGDGVDPAAAEAVQAVQGPVAVLEDPEGDAYHRPDGVWAVASGVGVCDVPDPVRDPCEGVVDAAAATQPAPPGADILGVEFTETEDSFLVSLELASVDPDFMWAEELLPPGEDRGELLLHVCLHPLEDWCSPGFYTDPSGDAPAHQLALEVDIRRGSEPALHASDWSPGGGCGSAWWYCINPVEVSFVEGSPGRVEWTLPRGYAPGLAQGDTFLDIEASTTFAIWEWFTPTQAFVWSDDAPVWAGVASLYSYGERFDRSERGAASPFTFTTPGPDPSTVSGPPTNEDVAGDVRVTGEPAPENPPDLLGMTLLETPETLTIASWFKDLDPGEETLYYSPGVRVAGAASLDTDILVDQETSTSVGWVCLQSGDRSCDTQVPVETEVVLGSIGWINVTVSRAELEYPPAGARIATFGSYYRLPAFSNTEHELAGVHASAESGPLSGPRTYDNNEPSSLLYRLQSDTVASTSEADVVLVPDGTGDYEAPPEVEVDGSEDEFDITHVQARQTEPGLTRFELGIAGLAGAETPPGYEGRAYVVGVQTDEADFMAGFYEGPGQTPDSFFCAPDTLLFRGQPADPSGVVLTPIEGKPVAGQSGGGALVFEVPAEECLAGAGEGSLQTESLAAGTFLFKNLGGEPGAGEVTPMDRADHDEPITLTAASIPTANPDDPWWSNAELWLIGLGALLVGAEGWILLGRRRRLSEARAEEREIAYANLVKDGVEGGASSDELKERLKPTRAALGISEKQHARVEAEVRSRLAGLTGGPRGLVPGEVFLDRYEVVRFLAAGGAGRTYLCRDTRLDREVVLKVLRSPTEDADMDPVLREARAFSAVRHDRVVMLLDIEAVGDDVYLVLEAVAGGSLKDRLEQGPLGPAEMARLGDDLLSGLSAVHTSGIVHRDVKPANVLVTGEGRFKLADFGIAHLPGYEETIGGLGEGEAVGTVRYMSPEQARGESVDSRSDLYSAALTLYEAWTGVPYLEPHRGESVVDVQLRAANGTGSLEECTGPAKLRSFFERALAVEPSGRFASADRMRVALLDALRDAESPGRAAVEHREVRR